MKGQKAFSKLFHTLTASFKFIKLYIIPFLYWKHLRLQISGVEMWSIIIKNSFCWVPGLIEKFSIEARFLMTNLTALIDKRSIVIIFFITTWKIYVSIFIWDTSQNLYILRDNRFFINIGDNKRDPFKPFETPSTADHSIHNYPFHQIILNLTLNKTVKKFTLINISHPYPSTFQLYCICQHIIY